mmetsp:Transcript_35250/g.110985  ORF Transcript_35250/g.110985 Transcript_35250/m.110985 type:complete len:390 (+) Transcript_35250:371-1540(+)
MIGTSCLCVLVCGAARAAAAWRRLLERGDIKGEYPSLLCMAPPADVLRLRHGAHARRLLFSGGRTHRCAAWTNPKPTKLGAASSFLLALLLALLRALRAAALGLGHVGVGLALRGVVAAALGPLGTLLARALALLALLGRLGGRLAAALAALLGRLGAAAAAAVALGALLAAALTLLALFALALLLLAALLPGQGVALGLLLEVHGHALLRLLERLAGLAEAELGEHLPSDVLRRRVGGDEQLLHGGRRARDAVLEVVVRARHLHVLREKELGLGLGLGEVLRVVLEEVLHALPRLLELLLGVVGALALVLQEAVRLRELLLQRRDVRAVVEDHVVALLHLDVELLLAVREGLAQRHVRRRRLRDRLQGLRHVHLLARVVEVVHDALQP